MRVLSAQGAPAAVQQGEVPVIDLRSDAAFYREGEYWTITYDGVVFRLRDTKGLHCVAYLLRHPHEQVAATDLLMIGGTSAPRPLAPSAPATPEQARMTVTKRIKAAVQKIGAHHASLGHHLTTCIKTGSCCTYMPDPRRPPAWTGWPDTEVKRRLGTQAPDGKPGSDDTVVGFQALDPEGDSRKKHAPASARKWRRA